LDNVWNFDSVQHSLADYQTVARKIRDIYLQAYPQASETLPDDTGVRAFVAEFQAHHPKLAPVQFWRVLVSGVVSHFDDLLQGETRPAHEIYRDVMDRIRET
jgi:hypothetical protein